MRQEERESILREDAPRAQTARERRELANLEEDLYSSPMRGAPLPVRLRNFRPEADGYLVSLGGPRHYMVRLREIEQLTAEHEQALGDPVPYLVCAGLCGLTLVAATRGVARLRTA